MNRNLPGKYLLFIIGIKILFILAFWHERHNTFSGEQTRDHPKLEVHRDLENGSEIFLPLKREIISDRIDHVTRVCSSQQVLNKMPNLSSSGKIWTVNDVSYCIVPKVGSTFWKQVMRYMSSDYEDPLVSKPSDIDRFFTQYGIVKNIEITQSADVPSYIEMYQNFGKRKYFMFARNPYTRLWSTFVDKFLLPDFWPSHAIDIAKFLRPTTNFTDLYCVPDISFEEFLTYLTYKAGNQMDEHWKPIYQICNPCHVPFDVIGKHETFRSDTAFIFKEFNISTGDFSENNTREIDILIRYNFDLYYWRHDLLKDCFDWLDIAKRLWFSFQADGFLHVSQHFPESSLIQDGFYNSPYEIFKKTVNRALELQTDRMKQELSLQKHTIMLKAFERIPIPVMVLLQRIYYFDFIIFQYDGSLVNWHT